MYLKKHGYDLEKATGELATFEDFGVCENFDAFLKMHKYEDFDDFKYGQLVGDENDGVLVGDDGMLHDVPTKVKEAFDDYFGVNSYADPDYFDDVNEYFDDLDDPDPNGFDDHDRA